MKKLPLLLFAFLLPSCEITPTERAAVLDLTLRVAADRLIPAGRGK